MRVLFISHDASRSGAPIALLQELKLLCQNIKELNPTLLLLRGGELELEFSSLCPVIKINRSNNFFNRLLRRLKIRRFVYPYQYLFHKGQFDGIYANTVASLELGCLLKKQLSIPLIGHIHEAEAYMFQFPVRAEWISSCDLLITVSRLSERNLIDNYGVPPQKIIIQHPISFWIDKCMTGDVSIPMESDEDKEILIGCFANGNWNKSTEIIPLIVKLFNDKYPKYPCRFLIIGCMSDYVKYNLEFDIRKMGIEDQIVIYGEAKNPLEILSRIKILMVPSREESFSLVAQEAGFMKKATVCFEGATGAAEWICNGAGVIVPYMDLEKMVDALYSLLVNNNQRIQYGETAKRIVEEMYITDSQMKDVISSIRQLFPDVSSQ